MASITNDLAQQCSPQQIQGRRLNDGLDAVDLSRKIKRTGDSHKNLRHKKYKQQTGSPDGRREICNRVNIEERPAIVDKKVRIGD